MRARKRRDVGADGDDGLVALVEDFLERHVEVVIEGGAAVVHVVNLARPLPDLLDRLLHEGDVLLGRGRDEEVVAALGRTRVGLALLAVQCLEVIHAPHRELGHVPKAALEELGGLLLGETAAALDGEARLDQTGNRRLGEDEDRVLLLHGCYSFFLMRQGMPL